MSMNSVNFFVQPASTGVITQTQNLTRQNSSGSPFMANNASNQAFYAKNTPIKGGYFAGYYNGRPNIVGQKLFIEI